MSSGIRSQAHLQVVPLEAVLVLADALQSIGRDVPQALARAGLSHVAWPLRGDIEMPVTRNAFARLAQDAVVAFGAHACRHEGLRSLPYSFSDVRGDAGGPGSENGNRHRRRRICRDDRSLR